MTIAKIIGTVSILVLSIASAATISTNTTPASRTQSSVQIQGGDALTTPVVTITAKRLTAAEKAQFGR